MLSGLCLDVYEGSGSEYGIGVQTFCSLAFVVLVLFVVLLLLLFVVLLMMMMMLLYVNANFL